VKPARLARRTSAVRTVSVVSSESVRTRSIVSNGGDLPLPSPRPPLVASHNSLTAGADTNTVKVKTSSEILRLRRRSSRRHRDHRRLGSGPIDFMRHLLEQLELAPASRSVTLVVVVVGPPDRAAAVEAADQRQDRQQHERE
jgi:hypothetical protein